MTPGERNPTGSAPSLPRANLGPRPPCGVCPSLSLSVGTGGGADPPSRVWQLPETLLVSDRELQFPFWLGSHRGHVSAEAASQPGANTPQFCWTTLWDTRTTRGTQAAHLEGTPWSQTPPSCAGPLCIIVTVF